MALDAEDQTRVLAEMERRYPSWRSTAFRCPGPLWHKKSGESLFITLLERPSKPSEACFTATFTAALADIDTLRRKYLRPELQI